VTEAEAWGKMGMHVGNVVGLVAGFVLTVALCACSRDEANEETVVESSTHRIGESSNRERGAWRAESGEAVVELVKSKRAACVTDDERADLSPADRKTLKMIEKAMEDEDIKILKAAVPAAAKSKSDEVRSETVDALAWFGAKTMDDLLPFLADPNEDIAENAFNGWTAALGEVEDESRKCAMIEEVMQILTNEESQETLVMELNNCEDILALQSVVNLIQCGNPSAVKVALGHYEFMTGEEFTTLEAAEAWAAENCSDDSTEN